jgi:undecaprenyl-diphosphatase
MIEAGHIIISVFLGLVQGITEWLPISSKTQIIIVSQYLLGLDFKQAYAFGLFMEIGTAFAAILYFRKEVWSLVKTLFGKGSQEEWTLFKFTLIATIVTGFVAVPLYLIMDKVTGGYNIGLPMIILGFILLLDAVVIMYSRSKYADDKNRKTLRDLGIREYVIVGLAQGLAALPGVSRSGTTTSIMLLLNIEAKEAFRLSFLIGIFAGIAAFGVTLVFSMPSVLAAETDLGLSGIVVSIIIAAVVSLFLINFLLSIAQKAKIVYLIVALGLIAIVGGLLISLFPVGFVGG